MNTEVVTAEGAPDLDPVGRRRSNRIIWLHGLAVCVFIVVMNQAFELKDRSVYEHFFGSLDSCQWLGCFLISDSVRSPVFLSLIIGGQRLGLSFDMVFTLISLLSVALFARAFRDSTDPAASSRFALISLTLGAWLYLIQVKLFLALALYLFAQGRSHRWVRIALIVASVLTHESMMFLIALHFLWRPSEFRISIRSIAILGTLVAMIAIYFGATSNVLVSTLYKIQRYNEFSASGDVPAMSRVGMFSALMLLFGMVGLLGFKFAGPGRVSIFQIKVIAWMYLPWVLLMVFAANEVFAIRLAELALIHAFLVIPLAASYRYPSRVALLLFAITFGLLTLIKDVILFA
jgi:hypothetical protein